MNAIAISNGMREETVARWKMQDDFPAGKWSGKFIPEVGDIIKARVNRIGLCRVLGYFVECGWVGVVAKPLDPPEWYVRQNGDKFDGTCGLFGSEIEQVA